jgi:hypothetical protein
MKSVTVLFFIASLSLAGFAQKFDYLDIRDSTALFTCVKLDSASIVTSFERLHAIDSTAIDSNLSLYLTDLANVYWMYAALEKDQKWEQESLAVLQRLVQLEPESWSAWKQLATQHAAMDNCPKAKVAWTKYRELAPKEVLELEDNSNSTFVLNCQ